MLMTRYSVAVCGLIFLLACQAQPQAPRVGDTPIVAKVGEHLISSEDLLAQVERIEARTPQVLSTHPQKKELLEQMINVEVLFQEAIRQGLDESYEFKARLVDVYIDELAAEARAKISEEQLRREYEVNARAYDQVAARHILLRTERLGPEEDRQKYQQMSQIRQELVARPDQFQNFARQYSEDTTARQGGDLGFFSYPQMVPEFSQAAFRLEIGEISPIVRTQFGYHLIQVTDSRRGFEYHRERILENMIVRNQQRALQNEINRLRSEVRTEIYESNLLEISELPDVILQDPDDLIPEDVFDRAQD